MVGEEGRGDGGEERGTDGGKVVTCARKQGAKRGVVWGKERLGRVVQGERREIFTQKRLGRVAQLTAEKYEF